MNLEIRRDTIYWHIKAIHLQEIIFVLNKNRNYWSTKCLSNKEKKRISFVIADFSKSK